jgi:hypothetical protein
MRSRRVFLRLSVIIFLGVAPAVYAQERRTDAELALAKKRFAHAEALETKGDWASALEALQQTASITMTPGIRYHIAFCQERMGRLVEASRNYALAQREAKASKGSAARSVLALVDQRFTEVAGRIPHVTLKVRPSLSRDVRVLVDRLPVALLPSGTFETDPGEHTIEVSAPGFAAAVLPLHIAEKELREVEIALVPVGMAAHSARGAAAMSESSLPTASAPRARGKARVGAIVATSAAAALVALGVGAYVLAGAAHDDGKAACAGQASSCDDLKGSVRTLDSIALGAWIGAAALGVTAAVLWFAAPGGAPKASPHISLGPGHVAIGCAF